MRVVFADQLGHLGEAYGGWWLKNSNDVVVNDVADPGQALCTLLGVLGF